MTSIKLSQITPAPSPPLLTDTFVGVLGGNADALISVSQLAAALSRQVNDGTVTGGVLTIDVSAGYSHKLTVAGNFTLAFANWLAAGNLSAVEVQLINGGAFALIFPAVNWYVGDGTVSPNFFAMGVGLQPAGTNVLFIWTTDGGTTLYGRAL